MIKQTLRTIGTIIGAILMTFSVFAILLVFNIILGYEDPYQASINCLVFSLVFRDAWQTITKGEPNGSTTNPSRGHGSSN